jgi:GxxExxY protein
MGLLFNQDLSEKILKAYFKVFNTLGFGFLEKVYENSMAIELSKMGIEFKQQWYVDVFYEGQKVGYYKADLIVEDQIIIELKAAESLREEDEYQLVNYLRSTSIETGLLLNFGKKPQFKRKVFENRLKKSVTTR